jgi:hypothetical protein
MHSKTLISTAALALIATPFAASAQEAEPTTQAPQTEAPPPPASSTLESDIDRLGDTHKHPSKTTPAEDEDEQEAADTTTDDAADTAPADDTSADSEQPAEAE